ncbi:MAG: hypothetical protein AB1633_11750, partial [Elusimicrobiota bacterium]
KLFFDGTRYFKLMKGHTIAARFFVGSSSGDIPYYYLFDIKGIKGLKAPGYSNYAGEKVILLDLEYRFWLFDIPILFGEWAEGVIFADAGRTWDQGEKIDLKNVDYALGPGLRFHFPMPVFVDMRIEYGFGKKGSRIYFDFSGDI